MKPILQLILGLILLSIVIAIGIFGITNESLPVTFKIIQYTVAAISGLMIGDAVLKLTK